MTIVNWGKQEVGSGHNERVHSVLLSQYWFLSSFFGRQNTTALSPYKHRGNGDLMYACTMHGPHTDGATPSCLTHTCEGQVHLT